jgi:NAD+ diphosphatase
LDYHFAFRSGQLDRAAQLRPADAARLDGLARSIVFWRGKLLADADNLPLLVALDHPALRDCRDAPVFLGLTDGGPRFAADLALWQPHADAATIGQFTDQSHQVHPAFPDGRLVEIRGLMASLSELDGEMSRSAGRCMAGTPRIGSAPIAVRQASPSSPAGSASVPTAPPSTFRAPIRW